MTAAADAKRIRRLWLEDRANRNQCIDDAKALLRVAPEFFEDLRAHGIPELVPLVDAARERGDEDEVERLEVYLLAAHPPQRISGVGRV